MIITKLISGLGNQLFQYAIGKQLSITRNTELKLDISFFESQNLRGFKLNNYNIGSQIATEEDISKYLGLYNNSLYSRIYRKAEKVLPRTHRKLFKEEVPWQYEPSLFKVSDNVYLDGYWQNYKYFENLDSIIYEEFIVKEVYKYSVQSVLNNINKDQNSVSIHIRRGDYVTDKEAFNLMGLLPVSYYYLAIDFIKQKISNPNFYIFSDDMDWVKSNLEINAPCCYVDGGKDYIDLELMSKCKHNIIANSSFSWWAAFLNRNPDKIVIAPEKWVIPPEINKRIELIFPSWIKI